jgi:selenide,water dikinase
VVVGLDAADDAAVYRISEDLAIVVTLDFFTPIVDDPYCFGAIAAANSLSDVYAMGARPILALNVAALSGKVPLEVSATILRGGAEKALEAGIPVAGGHTIADDEPKYGLVVLGTIDPRRLTRKSGARPGDRLLLTKPLGTGVVTTGLMRDTASDDEVEAATRSMMRLNAEAARLAREHGATAVTDITGFGLLGHASELAQRSGFGLEIGYGRLPWLPGAERLGELETFPGGARSNRDHFGPGVEFAPELAGWQRQICFSPETSGGLLIALPAEAAASALREAAKSGLEATEIGSVVAGPDILVTV